MFRGIYLQKPAITIATLQVLLEIEDLSADMDEK
jgi:hypothetical protein